MTELLEIPQEHLLQEPVQTVVLLEPQGSDDIVEVPTEQILLEDGHDHTLIEPVQELVLLSEAQQGPPGPPGLDGNVAAGALLERNRLSEFKGNPTAQMDAQSNLGLGMQDPLAYYILAKS